MNKRFSILIAGALIIALAGSSYAGDSWSLSKLNPFKKKTTTTRNRARARVSDDGSKTSGTPRLKLPSWGAPSHKPTGFSTNAYPAKTRKAPSSFTKLSNGTKDLFGKTKDVLMPWSSTSKKKKSKKSSTSRSKSKTSFLTSWLPKKEKKPKPPTLKSFLGQQRPM